MGRAPRALAALLVVAGLALTGCGGSDGEASESLHAQPLGLHPLDTTLTDTDGKPFSVTESTDKPLTLLFFGYTHCPDICGQVMLNLGSAMTRLDASDRSKVDVVFITTDPARDTGPVLRTYLDGFDKDKSFIGLTGKLADIVALGESVAIGMGDELPGGGYDVSTHSTQVIGVDSDDDAPVYWSSTTSSAEFASDIHTLVEDS